MKKDYEDELHKNIENYTFEDLFDIEDVQKLADALSKTFEVGVVITSPEGKPITKPSNFCDFCINVVRKTEKGLQNCYHSDEVLGSNHNGTVIAPCLSAGLLDAGTSIRVGGKHIASCLMGQVMIEGLLDDEELNRKRALDIGADPDEYIAALKKIPTRTREQFEKMVSLAGLVVQQLSELGYKNFLQKEEIKYRKKLEEEIEKERDLLHYLNTHDKLTGLYSRDYFEEMLAFYEGKEEYYPIAIISADVNNLKLMNDVFGHINGDVLIKTIADILELHLPYPNGIVSRYGGDEIQILLPNADEKTVKEYCKNVKHACKEFDGCVLKPSVSLGVHITETPNYTLSDALRFADEAMYRDKDKIKKEQNIVNEILSILYKEKIISRAGVGHACALASEFCAFLELDFQHINEIVLAIQFQDLGLIAFLREHRFMKNNTGTNLKEVQDTIKQHVKISHRIAKMFEHTLPVASTVLQTHECWDGTGYPNKLKGEEILLEARIIYLINTYVSMSDNVKYTKEDIIKKLEEEKGKRYEPELVDKFLEFLASRE